MMVYDSIHLYSHVHGSFIYSFISFWQIFFSQSTTDAGNLTIWFECICLIGRSSENTVEYFTVSMYVSICFLFFAYFNNF